MRTIKKITPTGTRSHLGPHFVIVFTDDSVITDNAESIFLSLLEEDDISYSEFNANPQVIVGLRLNQ